jgi:hypothetical protein
MPGPRRLTANFNRLQKPAASCTSDTSLTDTHEHLGTLTKAKDRPHVLDDATIDRVDQLHIEQTEFVDICTKQFDRWRTEKPSAS